MRNRLPKNASIDIRIHIGVVKNWRRTPKEQEMSRPRMFTAVIGKKCSRWRCPIKLRFTLPDAKAMILRRVRFGGEWVFTEISHDPFSIFKHSESVGSTGNWILDTFKKRECACFIPSSKDSQKCGCGKVRSQHSARSLRRPQTEFPASRWLISQHTTSTSTDAFGTIDFLGGRHAHKAHYIRLAFDTKPDDIIKLLVEVWQIPPPKLIITVHGGVSDFEWVVGFFTPRLQNCLIEHRCHSGASRNTDRTKHC